MNSAAVKHANKTLKHHFCPFQQRKNFAQVAPVDLTLLVLYHKKVGQILPLKTERINVKQIHNL